MYQLQEIVKPDKHADAIVAEARAKSYRRLNRGNATLNAAGMLYMASVCAITLVLPVTAAFSMLSAPAKQVQVKPSVTQAPVLNP